MPGMSMPGMNMGEMNPAGMYLMNLSSGTSVNPESWPMPMTMSHLGSWSTMSMGVGFLVDTQQSGPRGGDKLYSPNWFMTTAEHQVGMRGAFQTDLMLSLEPATITGERYPLLFQTGETAYGKSLADAQHPHNFIMALGFHYAYQLGENTIVDAYFAPVGDPALGPVAYPHRASAMELPEAPLSHHWQDSTHISDEVLTIGISHEKVRLEASGFYGSEPGENRWIVETGPIELLGRAILVFPGEELGRTGLSRKDRSSRGARAGRPGALDCFAGIHQTAAGRKLVFEFHLGTQPQHGHPAKSQLIPGRIGSSNSPQEFHYRPRRTGCQR